MTRSNTHFPRLSHAEVIARVQSACDDLVEMVTHNHQPPVSCRRRCDYCCRQPVFITPHEGLAIRDFVDAHGMAEAVRSSTARYLQAMASRPHARSGLATLLKSVQGLGPPPSDRQRAAVYGVHCPFLRDGMCSIYPARPLMCREHISFDDPQRCRRDEPFLGLEKPRFSEITAYLAMESVPPNQRMRPVYEFEAAAADAERCPPVAPAALRKALKWKTGRA
ncbi:MAG TPA: YkgJ family cysteine cluster protein [Armatimonadota bacterium]